MATEDLDWKVTQLLKVVPITVRYMSDVCEEVLGYIYHANMQIKR